MKKIIVVPSDWTEDKINNLKELIEKKEIIIIGGKINVYEIKDKEVFEVVNDLKKVGKIILKEE